MFYFVGEKIDGNDSNYQIANEKLYRISFFDRLEYRYMKLVENANPDDDTPVDNVCAQISDEEDSGDEIHFKAPSKTRKMLTSIRNSFRSVRDHFSSLFILIKYSHYVHILDINK